MSAMPRVTVELLYTALESSSDEETATRFFEVVNADRGMLGAVCTILVQQLQDEPDFNALSQGEQLARAYQYGFDHGWHLRDEQQHIIDLDTMKEVPE